MAPSKGSFSSAAIGTGLVIGLAAGAVIYHFAKPECEDPPPCEDIPFIAYFDREQVEGLLASPDAWGVRFYRADESGHETVVAVAIKEDLQHSPDEAGELWFRMYKDLSGSTTAMAMLKEDEALDVVRAASTPAQPTWSVDVIADVLRKELAVPDANAIGLVERATTDEAWTFEFIPVKLVSGHATITGTFVERLVGAAPCPRFCGADAAYYLHTR